MFGPKNVACTNTYTYDEYILMLIRPMCSRHTLSIIVRRTMMMMTRHQTRGWCPSWSAVHASIVLLMPMRNALFRLRIEISSTSRRPAFQPNIYPHKSLHRLVFKFIPLPPVSRSKSSHRLHRFFFTSQTVNIINAHTHKNANGQRSPPIIGIIGKKW